jgi:hypothetical protein
MGWFCATGSSVIGLMTRHSLDDPGVDRPELHVDSLSGQRPDSGALGGGGKRRG